MLNSISLLWETQSFRNNDLLLFFIFSCTLLAIITSHTINGTTMKSLALALIFLLTFDTTFCMRKRNPQPLELQIIPSCSDVIEDDASRCCELAGEMCLTCGVSIPAGYAVHHALNNPWATFATMTLGTVMAYCIQTGDPSKASDVFNSKEKND